MTSEDGILPLVIPSIMWFGCWAYYKYQGHDFARWYKLHTFHHIGAIVCGSISIFVDDDSIFNERIGILWSMPYFVVDILDCTLMGHFTYIAHGAICFGLGLCNYNIPLLRQLRMNSKASYIESSSIILYQVKQRRNAALFILFGVVYTLCRIVWIPIMANQLLEGGMDYYHPILIALFAFYLLQINWWIKIIKIALKGEAEGSKKESKEE